MGMTSSQRLQETLSHREPDRVPYVISAAMHPAREMGLTIKAYFSRPQNVVDGQVWLHKKFGNDMLCCYPFAALEILAWGGEAIYFDQGPPNAGPPIIKKPEDIFFLEPPEVKKNPALQGVLEAIAGLKAIVGGDTPIAGVIVSPFSLPIMQMGFEAYLDLIYERPDLLERLLGINTEYCTAWANAQLEAGAAAVMYSDPAFSPAIMSRDLILQYGVPTAVNVISRIKGSVMIHMASGKGLPVVDEISRAGFVAMSASAEEDLGALKDACRGRLALVGNLNALDMRYWTAGEIESKIKKAIAQAGPGGGFVLSDNHGEIPFPVDEDILLTIAETVRRWGQYPLDWIGFDEM
ncbi:MAG: uroporphyrinogen decarboxylase [Desulfobacterales bacterium RIFOXYA12_FULL_46_15]|nr:MAG: uroporphyrinogen decarboxylase [Desulfobacterales bacterium RIFOXYA12_FULL_46_15]